MRHRKLLLAIATIAAALILAACGSSTVTTVTQTTPASTPVAPAANVSSNTSSTDSTSSPTDSATSGNSNSSTGSDSGASTVPDVTGQRLDVAESHLDDAGLQYKEIGGGTFGIVVRANWQVCSTEPGAGAPASADQPVKLIVARPDNC